MNGLRLLRVPLAVLAAGFLVLLGILVSQVGGVQIRSASQAVPLGGLTSSQNALFPGAPTVFQVRVSASPAAQAVLRLASGTVGLGPVPPAVLRRGVVSLTVPCSGAFLESASPQRGRIVLLAEETGAVLAQSAELVVLPAGPDCFFR